MLWVEIVFNKLNLKFNQQNSAVSGKYSQQMELNALHALITQELKITTQIVAQTNAQRAKS